MKKTYLFFGLIFLIIACGRFEQKDLKGNQEVRIVSISKQYNEIIFALQAQQNIVAVDLTSTYPPEIKKLPTVGYHRALSAEAILSFSPTLILQDNNIGPEHVVKQLQDLHIPMKDFGHHGATIEGADSLMREMGVYFHREVQADSLCTQLNADIKTALEKKAQYTDTPSVLVIHFGQANNQYLVMTAKSVAAKMIAWAGGQIAIHDEKGMRPLSPEIIASANPDIILLTDFGYDRLGSVENVKTLPGIASTKAALHNQIYRVEEHDMVYIGPRTGANVIQLQKLLHPDVHKE